MKFVVLTDIHGNAPALKAVLEYVDSLKDVEHIYCLGDMVGIGPDTNEVLEMLFFRKDVSMILGNHDEAVLSLINGTEYPDNHSDVRKHHEWIAKRLDSKYVPKLNDLRRVIHEDIDDHSIYFAHYHIDKEKMNMPFSQDPYSRIVEPNLENMNMLFQDIEADLICFGHHHPLHYFKGDKKTFLNPGSLGCSHTPTGRFAIVTTTKENISIDLKEIAYDNLKFLASYEALKVPEREFILKVFHGNQLKIV